MLITICLSILLSAILSVPQTDFKLENEINIKADYIAIDPLNNLYAVHGNELKKIDLKTKSEKHFGSTNYGKITSIDVSDPFRTLLYYKDFNKLLWLDRYLSPILSVVSLDDLGFYSVASVCQSVNGGFWLFDQSLYQLVYIDKNLKVNQKSTQFSELIDQNTELTGVYMIEKNDYIYLGINGKSILLFDSYGTYIKTFPIEYKNDFQVSNETIIHQKGEKIIFYNTENYTENNITLPEQDIKQIKIINNRIFIKTAEKIKIYSSSNF